MSTIYSSRLFQGALCAGVAVVITAACGWGFVTATAHAPGAHPAVTTSVASIKIPLAHSVFGRPEPAVLVD
jgi:hypothetical protein